MSVQLSNSFPNLNTNTFLGKKTFLGTNTIMTTVASSNDKYLNKPYGKILLTLQNCLLPAEKLDETPSSLDGLDSETEIDLRILGCELIQTAGILLRLPQVRV